MVLNLIKFNSILSPDTAADQAKTSAITDTKRYIPVPNLSINDNGKILQQLKSGFKCRINWNKYQ